MGGRLLSGRTGPVAQFMYGDASGKRLTLYVSVLEAGGEDTAFRYAQEGPVGGFYWIDGRLGHALGLLAGGGDPSGGERRLRTVRQVSLSG